MPRSDKSGLVKTGIFGGSFDPPHNGHINLAMEAAKQLKLRRLLIIPTFESPHKATKHADFDLRTEMCRAAFSAVEETGCKVEVSDIERELGGVSYTINTLRELKKREPGCRFYLLIGGDMLYSFDKWFRYESILKESEVCAVARGGDSFTDMLEFANELGRVKVLPTDIVDISSTRIRESVKNGGDISEFVPPGVEKIISDNRLYKDQQEF